LDRRGRDRTFLSRLALAALAFELAAAGGRMPPFAFVGLIAAAVLGQLLLEAATLRAEAGSVVGAARPDAAQPAEA
jgi:hypothetical protein